MSELETKVEHGSGRIRRVIFGLIQMAVVVAFLTTAAVFSQGPSEEDVLEQAGYVSDEPGADILKSVRVIRPEFQDIRISVESTGTVKARAAVRLVPQVAGRITWISGDLRAGGFFEAGETLLKIDDEDYRLSLSQAQANLASARANLELQQAESDTAVANWKLLNPDSDAPPLVAKIPQMNITRASIESAQVQLDVARLNLRRTQFSLPFSGRIVESDAAVGQFISVGQSFGSAYNVEAVEIAVPLSHEELSMIEPADGRGVRVKTGEMEVVSNIDRVSSELDSRSRVAIVYAGLPVGTEILPGTFVQVEIEGKLHESVFLIPDRAEQSYGAFWLVRSGKLELIEPKILARMKEGIVVESFNAGQGIVIGTLTNVTAGEPVDVVGED